MLSEPTGVTAFSCALISLIITLLALWKARRTGSLKIPRSRPWLAMGVSIPLLIGANLLLLWTGLMPYGSFDFWGKILVSLGVFQIILHNRWIITAFILLILLCDVAAIFFSDRKDKAGSVSPADM